MLGGVPYQGGLAGQPVRVIRFGGLSIVYVKVAERGNPPNRGNQITTSKPAKTHGRTTWLPTAKTLIKLTVVATIMCLLSYRAIAFWTSPRVPGVACGNKYFFTTGSWGSSPLRASLLPFKQALTLRQEHGDI